MNSSLYDSYKTLRVFEAFAGYGSQSIALRNLGVKHEVVAISEIDKYALKAYYSLHSKDIPNLGDISKLKVEDMPKHDLFTYSFPCQDISVAGKQAGIEKGQTRSGLLYECERIIEHCKPKYLLMENVKNLVGKKFKAQFNEWLEYLEELGYTNYWKVLNAKDYGVPQNRERVFCISILGEHEPYKFPQPIKLNKAIKDILEDEVEEKYYLSDEIQKRFKPTNQNKQPKQILDDKPKLVGGFGEINFGKQYRQGNRVYDGEGIAMCLTAQPLGNLGGYSYLYKINEINQIGMLDIKGNEQVRRVYGDNGISPTLNTMQGGNRQPKIICEQRSDEGLRFFKDNICGTIRTINSGGDKRVIETDGQFRIRKLTPRECFRLMGMNDCDIDKIQQAGISNSQQYKLAGNSIVVNVLEAIFRKLFL